MAWFKLGDYQVTEERKVRIRISMVLVALLATIFLLACAGAQSQKEIKEKAEAARSIGEAYMRQGDPTSALRELFKAKELNPEDPIVYNDIGLCYVAKKMMSDAIANFKKAVALKPSYAEALNNLGSTYLILKEYDAAIEVLKGISKNSLYFTPQYPLANLGKAYFEKGEYERALEYYKEALEIQPAYAGALTGAGRTYLKMNQPRLAVRYLDRAIQSAPKSFEAHYFLAEAYLMTGNLAQARASYLTVIDLAPNDSEFYANALRRLGMVQ